MFGLKDFTQFEPYPIEMMNFKGPDNTVCELLRQTYHLTENDEIRTNIRIAMSMAKRMGDKLREYKRESAKWSKKD